MACFQTEPLQRPLRLCGRPRLRLEALADQPGFDLWACLSLVQNDQRVLQLSTGVRDAIQDASNGGFNSETRKGQVNISWQEDPVGLKLGEADGPGDGASGANVSMGTDIWYTWATVDLGDNSAEPPVTSNDFVLATPVRLTDNHLFEGIDVTADTNAVFDGNANEVSPTTIESGVAGASRANIAMVGNQALVAYEESKASAGAASGKFIRYHSFTFNKPTPIGGDATSNDPKGCVISDPLRNARRVRFLTQSPADAGAGGVQLAVFWKEGLADKGGAGMTRQQVADAFDRAQAELASVGLGHRDEPEHLDRRSDESAAELSGHQPCRHRLW